MNYLFFWGKNLNSFPVFAVFRHENKTNGFGFQVKKTFILFSFFLGWSVELLNVRVLGISFFREIVLIAISDCILKTLNFDGQLKLESMIN